MTLGRYRAQEQSSTLLDKHIHLVLDNRLCSLSKWKHLHIFIQESVPSHTTGEGYSGDSPISTWKCFSQISRRLKPAPIRPFKIAKRTVSRSNPSFKFPNPISAANPL